MSVLSVSKREVKIDGDAHRKSFATIKSYISRSVNLRPYKEALGQSLELYQDGICDYYIRMVIALKNREVKFQDMNFMEDLIACTSANLVSSAGLSNDKHDRLERKYGRD